MAPIPVFSRNAPPCQQLHNPSINEKAPGYENAFGRGRPFLLLDPFSRRTNPCCYDTQPRFHLQETKHCLDRISTKSNEFPHLFLGSSSSYHPQPHLLVQPSRTLQQRARAGGRVRRTRGFATKIYAPPPTSLPSSTISSTPQAPVPLHPQSTPPAPRLREYD